MSPMKTHRTVRVVIRTVFIGLLGLAGLASGQPEATTARPRPPRACPAWPPRPATRCPATPPCRASIGPAAAPPDPPACA